MGCKQQVGAPVLSCMPGAGGGVQHLFSAPLVAGMAPTCVI